MDLSIYFSPLEIDDYGFFDSYFERLGHLITSYNTNESFPALSSDVDIAIFGVGEDRGSKNNKGCEFAPDTVRR